MPHWLLILPGMFAGFIDSIAGGGGLITLPSCASVVGAGAAAIGTNKVVGLTGAWVALLVYMRSGHFDWRKSLAFAAWIGLGAFAGSRVAPLLPIWIFRWLLMMTCPVILYVVWNRDLWVCTEMGEIKGAGSVAWKVALSGLASGFYDGVWGPGGGTFMFLSLLFVARMPILGALAAAKFANTLSALVALASYAEGGFVHWKEGGLVALGMSAGAFVGARYATQAAAKAVRPVLAFVVALLLIKTAVSG